MASTRQPRRAFGASRNFITVVPLSDALESEIYALDRQSQKLVGLCVLSFLGY